MPSKSNWIDIVILFYLPPPSSSVTQTDTIFVTNRYNQIRKGQFMTDQQPFAQWLKRQRKFLDLTRDALGRRAHCSTSTIRRLEAGDLRPSKPLAESLAAVLEIPSERRHDFVEFARGLMPEFALAASPATTLSPTHPGSYPSYTNLPAPLTSFVGRKREVDTLCDLLQEEGIRLLTLTGPPGTGKTRLAVAAAAKLVDLAVFS